MKCIRNILFVFMILLLLYCNISCSDSGVQRTEFYSISYNEAFEMLDVPKINASLAVMPFNSLERYKNKMIYRKTNVDVGISTSKRWIELPSDMIRQFFIIELRKKKIFSYVNNYLSNHSFDYYLNGEIHNFDLEIISSQEIYTFVTVYLELINMKSKKVVWSDIISKRKKIDTEDASIFAKVMTENIIDVFKEFCNVLMGLKLK